MDLLAYWKWETYLRDQRRSLGFTFNSNQRRLFNDIEPGDRLWLVSGRPDPYQGTTYVLLSVLHVTEKAASFPLLNEYGKHYRVFGDPEKSMDFDPDHQDMTSVLMQLHFSPPRPIQCPEKIGQSLQTIRALSPSDEKLLEEYAARLRTIRLSRLRGLEAQ